jgi:hypothetical protein
MSLTLRARAEAYSFEELVDYYAEVNEPRHADAKKLLDYWRDCVDNKGDFIVGRDIPARPIASLLRSVVVYEPVAGGRDFRVRLAGDTARRRFDGDIKGALLSEQFFGRDLEHHQAASMDTIRTKRPLTIDSRLKRGTVEELHSEVLLLPVTAPDLKSTWLLVGLFFFS